MRGPLALGVISTLASAAAPSVALAGTSVPRKGVAKPRPDGQGEFHCPFCPTFCPMTSAAARSAGDGEGPIGRDA